MTSQAVGILLIAAAVLVVVVILMKARERIRSAPVTAALASAGIAVANGGLMIQDPVSAPDRIFATVVLALVVPLHIRVAVAFGHAGDGE